MNPSSTFFSTRRRARAPATRRWATVAAVLLASIAWAAPGSALAQAAPAAASPEARAEVLVELAQFKVVRDAKGQETFEDAATVRPGDVLEYRATYRNAGKAAARSVQANLPVPQGTEYLARSGAHRSFPLVAATLDGRFAAEPLTRTVKLPDGRTRSEPVPYAEYRSLRWTLGQMAPGQEVTVKARVQVSAFVAEPAPAPQNTAGPAVSVDSGAKR